jgi:hypothetical protein
MGVTNMQGLLNKLIEVLTTACGDALTVTNFGDITQFELELGTLGATQFDGLWGAANMPAQNLVLSFSIEADYISDGNVDVITDEHAMVYGSDIEYVIEDMIKQASGGLISGTGSEQGMQGDFEQEDGLYTHAYSIDVQMDTPVFTELTDTVYA